MLIYGSNFCIVTEKPRAFSRRPSDAAVIPFPSPETTPPVTKTYFTGISSSILPYPAIPKFTVKRNIRQHKTATGMISLHYYSYYTTEINIFLLFFYNFLLCELTLIQICIKSLLCKQFFMIALLNNFAILHD